LLRIELCRDLTWLGEEITRSAEPNLEMIHAAQQYQPAKPFAHPGTSAAIFRDES
jgi:hypothetical protein